MILLHAGFLAGQILLWGEIPASTVSSRSAAKEPTRPAEPPFLPFDAGQDRLRQALKEAGVPCRLGHNHLQTALVWLPTINKQPVPGSPLIAEPSPSSRAPKLAPWKISVIRLAWPTSAKLLGAGVGKEILTPGVLLGQDIRFWTTAWRWAGSLVARHQYLPGVEEIAENIAPAGNP